MKYRVECSGCGEIYETEQDFEPCFCGKCGYMGPEVVKVGTTARRTVERKMAELDEIRPRLEKAWDAYFAVRVEYEDVIQYLAQYHKRGIMSQSEYDRYRIRNLGLRKDLNAATREYRKNGK